MDPITTAAATITAVKGLIEIYQRLTGDAAGAARYRQEAEAAEAALPAADALLNLAQELTCKLTNFFFRDELKVALEAAKENPALRKQPAVLALALALLLPLSACQHRGAVLQLPETEETRAGYAVTWPADASEDPADYHTSRRGDRTITTAPRRP